MGDLLPGMFSGASGGVTAWLVGLAVAAFWVVGAFNRLVRLRNEVATAFAQIDVQLKRRHDLIPNLVDVARKYLQHERETLEAVIAARNQARTAADHARAAPASAEALGALAMAEQALGSTLSRLMAVVEAYPELQGDTAMRELSEELTSTENKIAFARQVFNDQALAYNNASQQFPTNLVAMLFRFNAAGLLESTRSEAERQLPRVQF